jgi:myo-inositol-1(or 4)-monophosphatase
LPATDLALLIDAARAAGRIATGYSGKTAKRWDKPDGAGPVTEADLAVNDMLRERLCAARPGYGWLSEEAEDDPARLEETRVFVIDPIDGTRSFAEGSQIWAHALAVVERGVAVAGVVYLPMRGLLYAAAAGQGAFLNGAPISPSARTGLDGAEFLATRPNMEARYWPGGMPRLNRSYRPSLAYRMALVAEGRYDGMLTLRDAWEWDIAAGDIILREAGAVCTDQTGAALRFNNPHPVVGGVITANATLHEQLLRGLGAA